MTLKTINIKGKDYVEVATRIAEFNRLYPKGMITTKVTYPDENCVRCNAAVLPDASDEKRYFTGHAEERRDQGNINRTNATENCETSAVGRALAMMGIGIITSIASADEVLNAVDKAETAVLEVGDWKTFKITFGKHAGKTMAEVPSDYLLWLCGQNSKQPDVAAALEMWQKDKSLEEKVDQIAEDMMSG